MGRKPNPLILEYFVRGPKLNDSSNRYPHTCKQCGENFPKGRIDSLTTHITKKCPAITDADRLRACLELHGIAHARATGDRNHNAAQTNGQTAILSTLSQPWSALETLAEASRQVDLNEHSRVQNGQKNSNPAAATATADPTTNGDHVNDRFELQEQYTLDNPPGNYDARAQSSKRDSVPAAALPAPDLSLEERIQALLPGNDNQPEASNISVAVAATARLNPSFLDPQLVNGDPHPTSPPTSDASPTTAAPPATVPDPPASQPSHSWGEVTYMAAENPINLLGEIPPPPTAKTRGGIPMDASDGILNGRSRHSRSRFTPARRREVQEVRKIGACIRCRILRKNCGKGNPCDTCRKVLAPRVWRTGCVRTRLYEQLDMWSAGVQVVLSQNRINLLKDQLELSTNGTVIEVSHLPETGKKLIFKTQVALLEPNASQSTTRKNKDPFHQAIMIDQEVEDIPEQIEKYVRDILPLFVEREPSKFMRVTLDMAKQQLAESEDDLLRKALELWGLVETIDRERQWTILEKPGAEGEEPRWVKEAQSENDADIYTMICMQLNAAAERKANNTSRGLLNLMDRGLTDSKQKVGFKMFLTAIIFLNCVEKSTWAFKAWEQDHLRPGWPLERDPSVFAQQGGNLAGLLKMLLAIRKALPQTLRGADGKLTTSDQDPLVLSYFQNLDLEYDTIQTRQKGSQFSPADSRSLELMFCSHLLLPNPST
ncbi:hypothetical protein S40285_06947 [Stachybotrys chlorohalonatus IBT 40285]|uniref:Zn(2)-C6 fungal-type domain-containing protein n=1 Tax=Stachybotrys chlorohalonatus (strain IBT 40285) TaxID=1283841 RepID=A0A084QBA3_STAC4|nr:hypothetical protein S40285_06947 [Stachybotrys chlorohalonata IBT 40285]